MVLSAVNPVRFGISLPNRAVLFGVSPTLLLGDVIVAFGGEAVRDPGDLRDLLGSERVGQEATLRIVRGGEPRELTLTVGERA